MTREQYWQTRRLLKWWLIAVGWMVVGYLVDITNPQGYFIAPGFEFMSPGEALFFALKGAVLEMTVLCVILRPWSFTTRTRYRSLLAFILFLPYFGYLLIFGDGKYFTQGVHLVWGVAVLIALGIATMKPIESTVDSTFEAPVEYEPKRLL